MLDVDGRALKNLALPDDRRTPFGCGSAALGPPYRPPNYASATTLIRFPVACTICPGRILHALRNSTAPSTRTEPEVISAPAAPPLLQTSVALSNLFSSIYSP